MKSKTVKYGVLAIVLGAAALSAGTALAYKGDPTVQGPNYTAARHTAMETAFENGDYAAWKTLMNGKGQVTKVVTQENFAQFAKAHELAEAGDAKGAAEIRSALGLGLHKGSGAAAGGKGMGRGMHR